MVNFEKEASLSADFDLIEVANEVTEVVLNEEGCEYECEIEILLTDEDTVRQINNEYRNIDKTTDVLSFPNVDWSEPSKFDSDEFLDEYLVNPDTGMIMLGQIVLNNSKIVSQALEYGHSIKREYAFLIAHSMLHLLGYDHMTKEEAMIMEKKQNDYLSMINITRED